MSELLPGCGAVTIEVDFQDGVLAACAEMPRVINPGGGVIVGVRVIQVGIPGLVNAGVAGRRLQLGRGLALDILRVP